MSVYTCPTLVIGNKNYSSWSLRPWLALRKASVPIEEKYLPLDTEEFEREIDNWSPTRRVPVLIDGDRVVWDSLAICEYVNEVFAEGALWPRNLAQRAWARSVCAEMHSGFNALRSQMPMNVRAIGRKVPMTAELEADIQRINDLWCECRNAHQAAGPWLFGEFSIADAMFAPVVFRFRTYDVTLHKLAQQYADHVLANEDVCLWAQAATEEVEIVEAGEVGTVRHKPEASS